MPSLTPRRLAELVATHTAPCVSLYVPVSRTYPDTQQTPILYKDLVRQAERELRERYPDADADSLLERLGAVNPDPALREPRPAGLAVFVSADHFETLDLPLPVPAEAAAADSFQVKPLLRLVSTSERFHALCLTRKHVRLFEGDRDGVREIELDGVPSTPDEALAPSYRRDDAGPAVGVTASPETTTREPAPIPEAAPGRPGNHPAKGKDAKLDAERFFHAVDRAVWERHSRPSGLPLVLVGLPENQALFRQVSHNGQLVTEGVDGNPDAFSPAQIHEAVWQVFEVHHQARLRQLVDDYHVARARGKASDDLGEVAEAAGQGRVGTLLLAASRRLPGTIDPGEAVPYPGGREGPDGEDMLDDLGEMVLRQKGTVLAVPADLLPSPTGVAAIYRY